MSTTQEFQVGGPGLPERDAELVKPAGQLRDTAPTGLLSYPAQYTMVMLTRRLRTLATAVMPMLWAWTTAIFRSMGFEPPFRFDRPGAQS
jgi:hypothetical protein